MNKNRRGISPVVATVLLILVAIILFVIIFWWVKQFIKETVQKDAGNGPEPIQNFCERINFNADVFSSATDNLSITVQNNGNVPIYRVEVKKKGLASLNKIGEAQPVGGFGFLSGDTLVASVSLTGTVNVNDEVLLVPVLIGQGNTEKKLYVCDDKFGQTFEVKAV